MRRINDHVINPVNDKLRIEVFDAPGQGGANHAYRVGGFELARNPSAGDGVTHNAGTSMEVFFQNGPIAEVGVNGVTQEALLAIVIDRLRSFQAGPFSCKENACALTKCEEALHWLQQRTIARMRRGVEGRNVV